FGRTCGRVPGGARPTATRPARPRTSWAAAPDPSRRQPEQSPAPRPDSQGRATPGPQEGSPMADPITVGIDVSKAHLDVAARPGDRFRVRNDPAGVADLVARLTRLAPALVVLEATGGYEEQALAALLAAGTPVAVVNPRQVRQ